MYESVILPHTWNTTMKQGTGNIMHNYELNVLIISFNNKVICQRFLENTSLLRIHLP